jgi:SAM-dependent methyltransferase
MKQLPEMAHSWADIHQLIMGDLNSQILGSAIQLKIFDALAEPATAEHVAENLGLHSRNTELFLNVLAGMDVIHKQNGRFSNTEKSAACLVSSSPHYLGAFFLHYRQWHEHLKSNLEELIKNGPPDQAMEMSDGAIWAESARLSAPYQYSGPAQALAKIVASQPEFPSMTLMLDLGGGAGFFTQAIVAAHPSMTGIVFEQPPVAPVTREFLKQYEADTRILVKEGDYTTDPLGNSYDLIFASATLNFHKHRLDELFAKVYTALRPGGIFLTHQDGIYAERTKPVCHLAEFLTAEMYGGDFAIPRGLIAQSMLDAGFQSVRSFSRQTDFGEMDIDIGRKAA